MDKNGRDSHVMFDHLLHALHTSDRTGVFHSGDSMKNPRSSFLSQGLRSARVFAVEMASTGFGRPDPG